MTPAAATAGIGGGDVGIQRLGGVGAALNREDGYRGGIRLADEHLLRDDVLEINRLGAGGEESGASCRRGGDESANAREEMYDECGIAA